MSQTVKHTPSLLHRLLYLLTKGDNEKERKEIDRYDDIEFVDAGKEIKKVEREKSKQKA